MNDKTSDQDLIEDVKMVSSRVKTRLTSSMYNKLGKYSNGTITERFGGWKNALKIASGEMPFPTNANSICMNCNQSFRQRSVYKKHGNKCCSRKCKVIFHKQNSQPKIPEQELIDDIKRVYGILKRYPKYSEYEKLGKYGPKLLSNRFGGWANAIFKILGEKLQRKTSLIDVSCETCGKQFKKRTDAIAKTKSNFCSHRCNGIYSGKNKTWGTNISKIEIYVQEKLKEIYPKIDFSFNCNDAIGAELDIYIPSLKIAFEINGPTHYRPIYGQEKFLKSQEMDKKKLGACGEKKIELFIIDISAITYFKPDRAQKFLDTIIMIINTKLNACLPTEIQA